MTQQAYSSPRNMQVTRVALRSGKTQWDQIETAPHPSLNIGYSLGSEGGSMGGKLGFFEAKYGSKLSRAH